MNKTITIKGIKESEAKHSESIRNYIESKMGPIEKLLSYVDDPKFFNFTIDAERTHHHHVADLRIHCPHNFDVIVKKEGPELYKLIDECLDVAREEITEHKRRMVDERKEMKKV